MTNEIGVTSRVNVLFVVHHHYDPNTGVGGVVEQLAREYRKDGHSTMLYTFDDLPKWIPMKLKPVAFPYFLGLYLFKNRNSFQIDVIDASFGDTWFYASFLKGRKVAPLLVNRSHGLEHLAYAARIEDEKRGDIVVSAKYKLYHGKYRLWEVTRSMHFSDVTLLLNSYEKQYVTERLNLSHEKALLMPNGVSDSFFSDSLQPTIAHVANENIFRIVTIGGYAHGKGTKYTAAAMHRLLENYDNLQIVFIGTSCTREQVLSDYKPHLHDRIDVIPYYEHSELPMILSKYDVHLFPSLSEGFSLALVEGMACGLASIATDIPGSRDIITDGHDGLLIPVRDSEAIEKAVETLLTNPAMLHKLGQAATSTAAKYRWSVIARRTLDIYRDRIGVNSNYTKLG